mmetsp:Transcript_84024/g.162137  ORF Transcript_84024/g.162137 Transcript_84024/m.162137 type:complete len:704 (+) Transcript_84024:49-2160(+)|eukprot:CAMPEP_0172661372 /NCGR_PEP_ID=MMETSP1074-20121228/4654_1 /TAXON_ID=2916 /ORGANISM="Ceratium fusus, Strain PA161109" /LENGTH=703 /DNA_ID=CAMNT_0013477125 /DNA_START=46 /DNA_END=2157 /DNA_ORIENTATION=-
MARSTVVILATLFTGAWSANPVQKVISLLSGLEAKIKRDANAEEKAYADYMAWCKDGGKEKEFEIKTAKSDIEGLTATIKKAEADTMSLNSKIDDLAQDISTNDADLKAAASIREKEHSEFVAAENELVDTVNTLERAINILERKLSSSAMLQAKVDERDINKLVRVMSALVDAAALSIHDKQMLVGLVQNGQKQEDDALDADVGAPDPAVYKERSKSIIDVLEDLKQKAITQLDELRRQETNARHNFALLKQSLEDQIKVDTKELDESKSSKHEAAETQATAEADLTTTKKDLAEDESILANMETDCKNKMADHEVSVKNRAEELKALASAKTAIMDATGGGEALVYNAMSFFQLDGGEKASRVWLAHFEVVNFLRQLAHTQHSTEIFQLAGRISSAMQVAATSSAGSDPFAKVKGLISDMIERLIKEAGDEANHKAYCDKEYADTKQKLDELKYDVEKYTAKLDKTKSDSATYKDEVATLQGEIAEVIKSQAKADKLRKEENKVYLQSKADLEQGLSGVRLALKILREYYSNQASLMQQAPESPEVHSSAKGAGGGIIAMLEVIESDFGKTLASTEMAEDAAATAYQKLSMENKMAKKLKEQDVEFKTKAAAGLDKATTELASDLDSTQTELAAVLEYSEKIRAMCEVKPETYEERAGRRQAEIEGLKEALKILEGEAVLLQRDQRHSGLRGAAVARHHAK